jgi:peptidoglycan L-alanyl-D-glutamate endopeptidase CwlK
MPVYSPQSEGRLSTCHEDIKRVFHRVIETVDHTIICGTRNKEEQDKAVAEGRSKTPWPKSKHNGLPSNAVDAMPYPFSWADLDGKNGTHMQLLAIMKTGMFIGYVLATADEMYAKKEISAPIRSGVDWDGDWNIAEHKFIDMPHFERSI